MIDVLELRNALETALVDELGTYTFPTGATTPAIAVDMGNGQYPPAGVKPEGLECVIVVSPKVQTEPL
ncbi:hypothetical protein IFO70_18980 [Phormidium tenue FACHB-886]|nr:hypothetical protein [Phormidium tenue FACHB-886]